MGFKERFPRWVTAILGIVQIILTAAIIGLEFGSFYYDVAHGTIWVGFWSGLFFIVTFLAMLFITCCCRGRYCATYILVLNIISGGLAVAIIYFDSYFMNNLCQCYLGSNLCCALHGFSTFTSNFTTTLQNCTPVSTTGVQTVYDTCSSSPPSSKLIFLKAQLGCAVGMLVACGLYVVAYIFACLGICFGHKD